MLSEPFLEFLAALRKSIPHDTSQCPNLGRSIQTAPGETTDFVEADPARAHQPVGSLDEAAKTADRRSRPFDHHASIDTLLPGNTPYGLEFE